MRSKFCSLIDQLNGNADVLMVTETKFDKIINGQFLIPGCKTPYRFVRIPGGCGIMLCIIEHTPSKEALLKFHGRKRDGFEVALITQVKKT